jgi:hypothetical protein
VSAARSPFPRKIEDDKRLVWGRGLGGRFLQVIFVLDEDETVYVIHARPLDDQEKRRYRRLHKMKRKPYWEMTADELAEATKQFDEPMVADRSRPLSKSERAQWNRLKRKRGRPKIGKGIKRISVSIEQSLLKRVTAAAKKRRISRSKLFALALQQLCSNR